MRIHLVSYATRIFRHRQWFLGASAKVNHIVDEVTHWSPRKLIRSGFNSAVPELSLSERGSGFWSWKPFIILETLTRIPDGDLVIYCDVGRKYPYLMLSQKLTPFERWMESNEQEFLPGVYIPWLGRSELWTKREAFIRTGFFNQDALQSIPIQASFSLWRNGPATRDFVSEWLSWCSQRNLISDDPGNGNEPESSEFIGHRHDQSLLTLCCQKYGIKALSIGGKAPKFNERDPNQVLHHMAGSIDSYTIAGKFLNGLARVAQRIEKTTRSCFRVGRYYEPMPSKRENDPAND